MRQVIEKSKRRKKVLLKKKILTSVLRPLVRLFLIKQVVGKENIPKKGPIVYVSSHKKATDPALIMAASIKTNKINDFAIPAKTSLFKNKLASYFIRLFNGIPTERDGHDHIVLMKLVRTIKNEGIVIIFPTATRIPDEKFDAIDASNEEQFKRGAYTLSKLKEHPLIVPVDITNGIISFGKSIFYNKEDYPNEESFCEDIKQKIIDLRPKVMTKKKH